VLIVSDEARGTELAQTLGRSKRFDVALASSDYEAGAQATRLEPDAVVLDMRGATLNCLALCKWLRTSPEGKDVSVLAVGAPEDKGSARAAGADAYLSNDAIADRMEEELRTLLEPQHRE
jgi:DNA-binding response OmpR family regulator